MVTAFILCAIGLLLIFLEFYLPGGIMGTAGGILLIISCVIFALQADSLLAVIAFVVGNIVAVSLLVKFALWRISHTNSEYSIYSKGDQEGYSASSFDSSLIGSRGTVLTDLKPGGHILIAKKKHQALSISGYITSGEEVIVVGGEGESLKVKQFTEEMRE